MPRKPDFLADLNAEQRLAVTHTMGPLLVVAGAGTGKTTVITRRIAWLIQEGLAKPEEILALTFTEKAAAEMEARIDQLVRYGQTGTTIATFHAFGDRLLREHALDLGLPPEFRVLAKDEQLLFLSERFDQIPELAELRPVGSPRKYLRPILKTISRAQDELVSPDQYRSVANQLLKNARDEVGERQAQRQADLANIYRAYQQFKADAGMIDFGDQITKLTDYLTNEPKVRQSLQSRFRFILVDEFQDTNVAQYQLVKLMLNADQNLTVVGDDNQAIYKFRGAAVANILNFLKDFPKAKQVIITQNYRSTQPILDAAYHLIKANDPDTLEAKLGISKHLVGIGAGEDPYFAYYAHEADELEGLKEIVQAHRLKQPLKEIAVLVRSNALIGPIASALARAQIPYVASSDSGFTARPEIRGIIAFFVSLVHPTDSLATMKLALSPYFQIASDSILPFNDLHRKTNRPITDLLADEKAVAWGRLDDAAKDSIRHFRDALAGYRQLIGTKNPGEILYQFLKDRGILNRSQGELSAGQLTLFAANSSMAEEERYTIIQNIAAVFEAIKGYIAAGRDRFALAFVDQLEELLANVTPPIIDLGPDQDAVRILTVHAAKGLEFEVVILPYLMAEIFPARRQTDPLSLPDGLIQETLPTGDEHLEEERRLFYVALTRAKRHLYLSASQKTGAGARLKKISPFVNEALGLKKPPQVIERVAPEARLHTFAPVVPNQPNLELPTYDGIYFLSPAMIETYLEDPYNFYWKYVLKAPSLPSSHIVYGTAIHAAIEAYYRLRKKGDVPTSEVEEVAPATGISSEVERLVLARYEQAWQSEGFTSQQEERRRFEAGKVTLKRFIQRAKDEPLPELVEEEFTLLVPGARIRGRMDAVFTRTAEIRDFKTSDVRTQKDADRKVKTNIPIRIYALAFKKRFGRLPARLTLDFVETGLKGSYQPTEQLMKETAQLIEHAIAGIKANHFDPNPHSQFKDYAD